MVEALVGISLVTIGLLGILHFISNSLQLNREVNSRFVGTYLAAEGIEVVKNIMDSDTAARGSWNYTVGNNSTYEVSYLTTRDTFPSGNLWGNMSQTHLTLDPDTGEYGYGGGDETPFLRTIQISGGGRVVTSIVRWLSFTDDDYDEVVLETRFSGWQDLE